MSRLAPSRGTLDLALGVGAAWLVTTLLSRKPPRSGANDPSGAERSRARAVDLMFPDGASGSDRPMPDPLDARSPAEYAIGSTGPVLPDPKRLREGGWQAVANSQSACRVLGSALADFESGTDPDDLDADHWEAISKACAEPFQCGKWTQRVHPTCRIGSDRGKVKGLGFTPSGAHMMFPYRQDRAVNDIVRNSGLVRAGRSGDVRAAGLRVVPPNAVQPGADAPAFSGSSDTRRFRLRQI